MQVRVGESPCHVRQDLFVLWLGLGRWRTQDRSHLRLSLAQPNVINSQDGIVDRRKRVRRLSDRWRRRLRGRGCGVIWGRAAAACAQENAEEE